MEIKKIDKNKFLFQFFHAWDMKRVFQGGTWLFENFMLVIRKLRSREDPLLVPLNEVEIWVQIHRLLFGFMSEDVGVLIGNNIGKFIKYDERNNSAAWRKLMRIKVAVNVQTLLKKMWLFELLQGVKV